MTDKEKDDLFYVCTLIEYIGRKTKNRRRIIVNALGEKGIKKQFHDAKMNHCLSFEQVSDEVIDEYQIKNGEFDTISDSERNSNRKTVSAINFTVYYARCV